MLFTREPLLCIICYLSVSVASCPKLNSAEPPDANATGAELQVKASAAKVGPAVVRIRYSEKQVGTGVIVTAEGHIATFNGDRKASAPNERITVELTDGRHATATRLGWSGEWRIAVLKIVGAEEEGWPHVDINPCLKVRAGQPCFLMGYSRDARDAIKKPIVRASSIEQSAFPHWCVTSEDKSATTGGLFDIEGNFLGITTRTRWPTHTCVNIFAEYWPNLVGGKNLDRLRLTAKRNTCMDNKSPERREKPDDNTSSIERAKSSTVRIEFAGKPAGSGVLIASEGYVVTHSHGRLKRPGDEVAVAFADGSRSQGRVVNTNPVTDIALIKLTGNGPWPYVTWGSSVRMQPGEKCILCGYPRSHSGKEPAVNEARVVEPNDLEWSHLLWTTDYGLQGGESGGGVFDEKGRLLGLITGYRIAPKPRAAFHVRVEVIRNQWSLLHDLPTARNRNP
ncbi:serine protease [Symmachiella dynata]|uniref:serine protease n=1 Tax=Symmachiella dynata TaxID=2527995 RepID=UPI0030EC61E0|tara:strand:+ start:638 stop:1993 length:1356 start_codon:yes stop_codon:yes gene_type:complete